LEHNCKLLKLVECKLVSGKIFPDRLPLPHLQKITPRKTDPQKTALRNLLRKFSLEKLPREN